MRSNLAISRRTLVATSTALALGTVPRWSRHTLAQDDDLVFWDSHNSGGMQEIVETLAEEYSGTEPGHHR